MTTATSFESLLKARKGTVAIVDVPEFGFAVVTGSGVPEGPDSNPPDHTTQQDHHKTADAAD